MIGILQNEHLTEEKMHENVNAYYENIKKTIRRLQLSRAEKDKLREMIEDCCRPDYSFEEIVKADFLNLKKMVGEPNFKRMNSRANKLTKSAVKRAIANAEFG